MYSTVPYGSFLDPFFGMDQSSSPILSTICCHIFLSLAFFCHLATPALLRSSSTSFSHLVLSRPRPLLLDGSHNNIVPSVEIGPALHTCLSCLTLFLFISLTTSYPFSSFTISLFVLLLYIPSSILTGPNIVLIIFLSTLLRFSSSFLVVVITSNILTQYIFICVKCLICSHPWLLQCCHKLVSLQGVKSGHL